MGSHDHQTDHSFDIIISINQSSNLHTTIQPHKNNSSSNPYIKMQFFTTILAFATAAMAVPAHSQCTFGQYVCSTDGLSILQCDISGKLVVSNHSVTIKQYHFYGS